MSTRQVKTNFQQLCFQVPPQGPWGKAWFSGQAPATLWSLPANSTGSASHFPQSSWHQLPKPSWKHSAGMRRALQMPGSEILHSNKGSLAAAPAHNTVAGQGLGEAARGQAGDLQPGKQLWVWETCLFPDFRASPLSQPTATNYWASRAC